MLLERSTKDMYNFFQGTPSHAPSRSTKDMYNFFEGTPSHAPSRSTKDMYNFFAYLSVVCVTSMR